MIGGTTQFQLIPIRAVDIARRILLDPPAESSIEIAVLEVDQAGDRIGPAALIADDFAVEAAGHAGTYDRAVRVEDRDIAIGVVFVPLDHIPAAVGDAGHVVVRVLLGIQPLGVGQRVELLQDNSAAARRRADHDRLAIGGDGHCQTGSFSSAGLHATAAEGRIDRAVGVEPDEVEIAPAAVYSIFKEPRLIKSSPEVFLNDL